MNRIILAVAMVFVVACSSNNLSTEPVVYSQSEAADSVRVRVGQTIVVEGIRLRFTGVESDSRCPSDVVCVWAGDATANFVVEENSAATNLALHIMLEPRAGTAHGFRVELRALLPYPNSTSPIKPDAYSAWLKIVRVNNDQD